MGAVVASSTRRPRQAACNWQSARATTLPSSPRHSTARWKRRKPVSRNDQWSQLSPSNNISEWPTETIRDLVPGWNSEGSKNEVETPLVVSHSLSLSLSLTLGQCPHVLRRPLTRIDHCGVFHYCQSSRFSSCWVLQAYRRPNPRRPRWAVFTPYKYSAVAKTFLNGGGCQTQGWRFHRKINFL